MADNQNPFASPASVEALPEAQSAAALKARRIRQANSVAERALRQEVLLLIGFYFLMSGVGFMWWYVGIGLPDQHAMMLAMGIVFTLAVAAGLVIGFGVGRLKAWSRTPLIVLCAVGLPLFPFGTFIAFGILRKLYAQPGVQLLTPEYERIVRESGEPPGGRRSVMAWIGAILLVVLAASTVYIYCMLPEWRGAPH